MKDRVKRGFFSTLFVMYFIITPFFLHQDSFELMKSLGFIFGVLALLVRYGQGWLSHDFDELKNFFLP